MSASSVASDSPRFKYDVFLSFSGSDTRNSFTSHLHAALLHKQINTFIDDQLTRGEDISSALLKVIETSMVSIVIFSQHYAASPWCLEELVKILDCRKVMGSFVLPVFYSVDPSDVAEQTGSFGQAFRRLAEEKSSTDKAMVQRWRAALSEAAGLSGWSSLVIRPEFRLIQEIVKHVMRKLDCISSWESKGFVGVHSRIEKIESLLWLGSPDVQFLGIWGMGGVGKTTLTELLFEKIKDEFDASCFLANVMDNCKSYGLPRLTGELLSTLLDDDHANVGTHHHDIRTRFVKNRLSRMKVLIVLDDVSDSMQVERLAGGHDWFGPGSRIIITSRDKKVLDTVVDEMYEVERLNDNEALQLFSSRAFRRKCTSTDYLDMSRRAANYADGNPLALKVMGSSLYGRTKAEWKCSLQKIERIPKLEIQNVLRTSYDGLDDEEKEIFLDIACFFVGEHKGFVTRVLYGCGFGAEIGIRVLIDKSLVTVSDCKLGMHALLQQMGRDIVRQESVKEPGKRTRLWCPEDVYRVLTKNTGTESVEGIFLDMSKIEMVNLSPKAFARMHNLRLLKFYNSDNTSYSKVCIPEGLNSISDKLSYLYWDGCPLKSLPSIGRTANLVELSLPSSHVEVLWERNKYLEKLHTINLGNSQYLTSFPNLASARNLQCLNLEGCMSLVRVPSSIKFLKELVDLTMENCKTVRIMPSCIDLLTLKKLNLSGCSKLRYLQDVPGSLEHLSLNGTSIRKLPASMESLSRLTFWGMNHCKRLKYLPSNIGKMKSLKTLSVSGCSKLEGLPSSIKLLSQLQKLVLSNCKRLRTLPELPLGIGMLNANDCISLERLPSPSLVSMRNMLPKNCHHIQMFSFANCLKLYRNVDSNIEADSFLRIHHAAISAVKNYHQGIHSLPSNSICYPARNVPRWFRYQSNGSSITIDLPPNWLNDDFLGIALSAVIATKDRKIFGSTDVGCQCSLRTADGDRYDILCCRLGFSTMHGKRDFICADHVVIRYDFSLCQRLLRGRYQQNNSRIYRTATFKFYPEQTDSRYFSAWFPVEKCGVHLLYAQYEVETSSVSPLVHPSSPSDSTSLRIYGEGR
ncbi:Disease resistance-like protein DSC1 [Linum perenne]